MNIKKKIKIWMILNDITCVMIGICLGGIIISACYHFKQPNEDISISRKATGENTECIKEIKGDYYHEFK